MEHIAKKVKVTKASSHSSEPFKVENVYDDEITLQFEEKKLFVSRNFLSIASPVFEAMFKNEFKERKEKRVQMTGKSYDDFHELLLCIHPRIQKEVDATNALRIAPIADEYQVNVIVEKCKIAMKSMLTKAIEKARSGWGERCHLIPLRECFNVLKTVIFLRYIDISDISVNTIAKFGYCLYNNVQSFYDVFHVDENSKIDYNSGETYADVHKECISAFSSLPLEWQNKILIERLKNVDSENKLK